LRQEATAARAVSTRRPRSGMRFLRPTRAGHFYFAVRH
jgi:hypothetical protein